MLGISVDKFMKEAEKKGFATEKLVGVSGAILGVKVIRGSMSKKFSSMRDAQEWLKNEAK